MIKNMVNGLAHKMNTAFNFSEFTKLKLKIT